MTSALATVCRSLFFIVFLGSLIFFSSDTLADPGHELSAQQTSALENILAEVQLAETNALDDLHDLAGFGATLLSPGNFAYLNHVAMEYSFRIDDLQLELKQLVEEITAQAQTRSPHQQLILPALQSTIDQLYASTTRAFAAFVAHRPPLAVVHHFTQVATHERRSLRSQTRTAYLSQIAEYFRSHPDLLAHTADIFAQNSSHYQNNRRPYLLVRLSELSGEKVDAQDRPALGLEILSSGIAETQLNAQQKLAAYEALLQHISDWLSTRRKFSEQQPATAEVAWVLRLARSLRHIEAGLDKLPLEQQRHLSISTQSLLSHIHSSLTQNNRFHFDDDQARPVCGRLLAKVSAPLDNP